MISSFEEAVNYIESIPRFTKKHEGFVTVGFLDDFGKPDMCPSMKIIHIAGTNGKGSVSCYTAAVLRKAGYHVGMFTSPHLTDIRERFLFDGQMMNKDDFVRLTNVIVSRVNEAKQACKDAGTENDRPHPTYFEFLFLLAMLWYAEKRPDYLVLEVGLGGRLDATNSVRKKEVSVITRIGLDHMQYLGNTVEQIAGEKAGILMEGVPAVFLDTPTEASSVVRKTAEKLNISYHVVHHEDYAGSTNCNGGIDFSYSCRYDLRECDTARTFENVHLHSPALYQAENAALSVMALRVLKENGANISDSDIKEGLEEASWPGRMEEILPDFYIDGAHNDDGIRAFVETVTAVKNRTGKDCVLFFSAVKDKQYEEELARIARSGLFVQVVTAPLEGERALDEETLKQTAERVFGNGNCACELTGFDDIASALSYLKRIRSENGCIVFAAGSLYLVGEIRKRLRVH